MKQIRRHITYANVMSSLAVFMILGGATAFAALSKNSVGPKQLKKNAVTSVKISKNAVTAEKIKDGSLLSTDFKVGQLPAGPKGDTGAKGDVGPTFGRSDDGGCDPESTEFDICATTGPIDLPTSGRVLLVGASSWDNDNEALAPNSGTCRLTADGNEVGPEEVDFGEETSVHTIGKGGSVAVTTVTGPLSAGTHTFSLECNETNADVFLTDSTLSAVLLGGS